MISAEGARQKIEFNNCKIISNGPVAFGNSLKKAKFTTLCLPGCGAWDCGDWKGQPSKLVTLLDSLCSSEYLKKSLKWLEITPVDFNKMRMKSYLTKNGFELL